MNGLSYFGNAFGLRRLALRELTSDISAGYMQA